MPQQQLHDAFSKNGSGYKLENLHDAFTNHGDGYQLENLYDALNMHGDEYESTWGSCILFYKVAAWKFALLHFILFHYTWQWYKVSQCVSQTLS